MKCRSFKIYCWKWLYRHTHQLRWLAGMIWPLHQLPRKLTIELELRRCERSWKLP